MTPKSLQDVLKQPDRGGHGNQQEVFHATLGKQSNAKPSPAVATSSRHGALRAHPHHRQEHGPSGTSCQKSRAFARSE